MSPRMTVAKTRLTYPIYSASFDPQGRDELFVGGGGGEGRSGIPNKISLLDVTSSTTISTRGEIDLSREEDSIRSLGAIADDKGYTVLAGINSSRADVTAGKNEHLRTFKVKRPNSSEDAQFTASGKSAVFRTAAPNTEPYQGILRLSPGRAGQKRIAAIASRDAKREELVIFSADRVPPTSADIITRAELPSEAVDVDLTLTPENAHTVCWCTKNEVYEQTIMFGAGGKPDLTPRNPRRILSVEPSTEAKDSKMRIDHRSVRFLTAHHVLILSNVKNPSSVRLSLLHVYPTGPGAVIFRKTLPSRFTRATAFDVCGLDADGSGNRQWVIAVGGQDAVHLFTTDYHRSTDTFTPLAAYTVLRGLHLAPMTVLALSPFVAPEQRSDLPVEERRTLAKSPRYIKLASADVGNNLVVHTFALSRFDGQKSGRQVLRKQARMMDSRAAQILLFSLFVLFLGIAYQIYLSPGSARASMAHAAAASDRFSSSVSSGVTMVASATESVRSGTVQARHRIRDTLKSYQKALAKDASYKKGVIIRPDQTSGTADLGAHLVEDRDAYRKRGGNAKHWHELAKEEKEQWKQHLIKAGEWAVEEGETVFKGILFGSLANVVRQAAGG